MGKRKEFQIKLSSNKTVYSPGESVTGDLIVNQESPGETKGIKIKFHGEAEVDWVEKEQRQNDEGEFEMVDVHYRRKEVLFKKSFYVFGKKGEKETLHEGEHAYPFSFQLPAKLPTSYEDHIAHIRYEIRATIKKPHKKDPKTRKVFTVIETLDLNTYSDAMKPAVGTETKYLCCLCCKSGPIKVEFQSDRSAYVPGEFVTINATLKNKSNSKVKATSVTLLQRLTYNATEKSQIRWVTICSMEGKECPKKKTISWTNEKLQIPPVPPTSRGSCEGLDIKYFLLFQGHLRLCAVDLREDEEITIGTVPRKELYQNMAGQQSSQEESGLDVSLPSAVVDENGQSVPVPTTVPPELMYKEIEGGAINFAAVDDHGKKLGATSYAPQYAYYDWSQSTVAYE